MFVSSSRARHAAHSRHALQSGAKSMQEAKASSWSTRNPVTILAREEETNKVQKTRSTCVPHRGWASARLSSFEAHPAELSKETEGSGDTVGVHIPAESIMKGRLW